MTKTWTYASEDFVLELPADLPDEGVVRPVRYDSTLEVFWHAVTLYRRYFLTIAGIFLLPMLIGEVLVRLARGAGQHEIALVVRWIATVVAFAPLVLAVSDICVGNRPSLRRSYQRTGWRTVLKVTGACAMATAVIAAPFAVPYGIFLIADEVPDGLDVYALLGFFAAAVVAVIAAGNFFVWVLYVPVIIVVEPRVGLLRAVARSRWLGRGYMQRTVAVILVIALILGLSWVIYQVLDGIKLGILGVLVSRLLGPVPYIAATLIYYDLRARKEGYGIAERPEDLT